MPTSQRSGIPSPHLTKGNTVVSSHRVYPRQSLSLKRKLGLIITKRMGVGAPGNTLGPFHPQALWSLTLLEEICMLVTAAES